MTKARLLSSVEITINETLARISKIKGLEKQSLEKEFKEWIEAIQSGEGTYDVLFINKIKLE